MKIKIEYPPNYEEIVKHFPSVEMNRQVVFTYGNTLYTPGGDADIPEHLMKHEETHERQQLAIGVDVWWNKYFSDVDFRLEQELEAYRNQYIFIKETSNRQGRRQLLQRISKDLSSAIYGKLVTKEEAKNLIENYE